MLPKFFCQLFNFYYYYFFSYIVVVCCYNTRVKASLKEKNLNLHKWASKNLWQLFHLRNAGNVKNRRVARLLCKI